MFIETIAFVCLFSPHPLIRSVLKSSTQVKLSSDEMEVLCPVDSGADDAKNSLLSDLSESQDERNTDEQSPYYDAEEEESWDWKVDFLKWLKLTFKVDPSWPMKLT